MNDMAEAAMLRRQAQADSITPVLDAAIRRLEMQKQQANSSTPVLDAAVRRLEMQKQQADGVKYDADKVDPTFLDYWPLALAAVCEVSAFGAKKYSRGAWLRVPDGIRRYTAAMLRHLLFRGGMIDEESGLMHDAMVAWNALSRLELILRGREEG